MTTIWQKPLEESLSAYQRSYTDLIKDADLIQILTQNLESTIALLKKLSPEELDYRYATGKWSILEIIIHLNDCERIFAYRILRIVRGDKTPMAGFEEDDYMKNSFSAQRIHEDVIDEFINIRKSTISLLKSLNREQLLRTGIANNNEISAITIAYMLAGHEVHHINVIKERYIVNAQKRPINDSLKGNKNK